MRSSLFEISRVFVRFDHVARFIVNITAKWLGDLVVSILIHVLHRNALHMIAAEDDLALRELLNRVPLSSFHGGGSSRPKYVMLVTNA